MLETIVVVTLITLIVVAPVIGLAYHKAAKELKEKNERLEHPERLTLKGE